MKMIVICDNNFGISYQDKPLVSIPQEQKSKMQEIAGKVIVYGVKAIPNLPGQQPVQGCVNIIFTDGVKTDVKTGKNVYVCPSLEEVRKEASKYPTDEVYIIDNEKLYREFLKDTDTIHMTKVDYEYRADAFFENLDKDKDFHITQDSDELYCFDIVYSFLKYERRKV